MRNWLLTMLTLMFFAEAANAQTASAPSSATFNKPQLSSSVYQPTSSRDPMLRPGGASATTGQAKAPVAPVNFAFRLEGIHYHPTAPAAVLNRKLIYLNKPVKLTNGSTEIMITAVEITRERVVIEASGERIELRLRRISPTKSN